MSLDQIAPEALRLPPRERALLAASLWESIEDPYVLAAGRSDEDVNNLPGKSRHPMAFRQIELGLPAGRRTKENGTQRDSSINQIAKGTGQFVPQA